MATVKPIIDSFYASYCAALASLDLQGPQSIVVALGGGADSQSVLDLTLRYRQEHPQHDYLAIHLDHYFHPKSPQWAEFLRQYCVDANIAHIVEPIQVSVQGRQSKEAEGRDARYQRLAELTSEQAVILLGHHLSDQSETFFLQLKRGSGPKGLSSMASIAPFVGERRLCRPLLGHSKEEIYTYANARGLRWIEDDTNIDTSFERNFLRHDVIPVLNARWPQFEHTLARSARLCAQQQALLDELLAQELSQRMEGNRLAVGSFTSFSHAYQSALIRLFLQRMQVRLPSEAQLNEVLKQLAGKAVNVRWGQQQLRSYAGYLYLLPVFAEVSDFRAELRWQASEHKTLVELPDAIGVISLKHAELTDDKLADDKLADDELADDESVDEGFTQPVKLRDGAVLQVALAQPGDKFKRRSGGQWHSIAHLLKKQGVPPWQRQRWPVLWADGELAWAAQLGGCQGYAATWSTHSTACLIDWQKTPHQGK